ncbi:MAG: hypothetical protein K6E52_11600 [Bacteroidaceae bacterium]|nr:hypothetical protein [Bacteroidaceae bacterium]
MKYIVYLFLTSFVITACSSYSAPKGQTDDACSKTKETEAMVRLSNLCVLGNYEEALALIDTLQESTLYAPNYLFCQGWCYDMLGDSLKAKECYLQAKDLYNKYNVYYDASSVTFSKAYVILCLEGRDAFFYALDSLCDDLSRQVDYIRKMKTEWEINGINKKDLFPKENKVYFIPNKE